MKKSRIILTVLTLLFLASLKVVIGFALAKQGSATANLSIIVDPASGGGGLYPVGFTVLPHTTITEYCPNYTTFPVQGTSSCDAVVKAWPGSWADTSRNRMVLWGGGHTDYHGNEFYTLNVLTGVMQRATNPTVSFGSGTDLNADGTMNSAHPYDGMAYIPPPTDLYFRVGGSKNVVGFASSWTFLQPPSFGLPTAGDWHETISAAHFPEPCFGTNADYDPIRNRVYVWDENNGPCGSFLSFGWFDPTVTGGGNTAYHALQTNVPAGNQAQTCRVDTANQLFACVGGAKIFTWDISNDAATQQDITSQVTGCAGSPFLDGTVTFPLTAFYPARKELAIYAGGNTTWLLNLATKACESVTFSGGITVNKNNGGGGMGGTLMQYFPAIGGFVICPNTASFPFVTDNANCAVLVIDAGAQKQGNGLEMLFARRTTASGVTSSKIWQTAADVTTYNHNSLTSGFYPSPGGRTPVFDSTVSNSGNGSLKFTIPASATEANVSGNWAQFFNQSISPGVPGGKTFYVTFKFRADSTYVNTHWTQFNGSSTPKIDIISPDDDTCSTWQEITTLNWDGQAKPVLYGDCGGMGYDTNLDGVTPNPLANPPYLAQQGAYSCSYINSPGGGTCFTIPANTWVTFYYQITIGTLGTASSSIKGWIGVNGQPLKRFINAINFTLGGADATPINSITFTDYMTGFGGFANPAANTWIDEVIVSTSPIPTSYGPVPQ